LSLLLRNSPSASRCGPDDLSCTAKPNAGVIVRISACLPAHRATTVLPRLDSTAGRLPAPVVADGAVLAGLLGGPRHWS
jgi:hypothetical protein